MRRAILALGGTVAAVAALLAVKFQPADSSTTAAGAQAAPAASGSQSVPAAPSGTAAASGGGSSAGGAGGTAQSTASTFTGAVDNTSYGPMQVQISVSGKKITKVTVLQQTNTGSESQSIDAMAIPKLTTEALAAQNANIDAVSGASYTSAGYKQSLQSAIDKAGL